MKYILMGLLTTFFLQLNAQNRNDNLSFTDLRDGKTYNTIRIGQKILMAENLAYKPDFGNYWAYNNNQSNVAKYGYLYDWETAKNVCPKNWHLPSDKEFMNLADTMNSNGISASKVLLSGSNDYFAHLGSCRKATHIFARLIRSPSFGVVRLIILTMPDILAF